MFAELYDFHKHMMALTVISDPVVSASQSVVIDGQHYRLVFNMGKFTKFGDDAQWVGSIGSHRDHGEFWTSMFREHYNA